MFFVGMTQRIMVQKNGLYVVSTVFVVLRGEVRLQFIEVFALIVSFIIVLFPF